MADAPIVDVVGLKALARDVNKLTDDQKGPLLKAMQSAGKTAAEPVAAATRSALPRSDRKTDAGRLRGSVRTSGTRTGASVRMGSKAVPWAGWVEFGGTRHRPFPSHRDYVKDGRYLFPAARGLAERSAARRTPQALSGAVRLGPTSGRTPPSTREPCMTSPDQDEPVEVGPDHPMRLSAEALRALKKATGRSLTDLTSDDDDIETRFQVTAFAELYRREVRRGHMPEASVLWERAGRVELDFVATDRADPLGAASSTTPPPS